MGAPYQILQEWLKLGLDDSFMDYGACSGADVEMQRKFFSELWRGKRGLLAVAEAKRVCTIDCEVNVECLEYALEAKIDDGIWGGTTPEERAEIRRRRALSPPSPSKISRGPSTTSDPAPPSSTVDVLRIGESALVG